MNRRGRKPQVVDTNVVVVANRRHGESYKCAARCARALLKIKNSGVLVIDDRDRILFEYRTNCRIAGQPGVGDSFTRWAHDHIGQTDLVNVVPINPSEDPPYFTEFPDHKGLEGFDISDRKFVAVANAHAVKPSILQATDSKWWGWKDHLAECGITVEFLCPDEIAESYHHKIG
jgi:hypothetical protein